MEPGLGGDRVRTLPGPHIDVVLTSVRDQGELPGEGRL